MFLFQEVLRQGRNPNYPIEILKTLGDRGHYQPILTPLINLKHLSSACCICRP